MPILYEKGNFPTDKLEDLSWFAEEVGDFIFCPGSTQESLEENLQTLRNVYSDNQLGGTFIQFLTKTRLAMRSSEELKKLGFFIRVPYTYDDFVNTTAPFDEIAAARTPFEREQISLQMRKRAVDVGITKGQFDILQRSYSSNMEEQITDGRVIAFPVQKYSDEIIRLDPGDWHISAEGIYRENGSKTEYACFHLIAPVERYCNIDTGIEKLTLAFDHNGETRYITRSKIELFDSKKIISLAEVGVAVTSRTASALSDFLNEIEVRNKDKFSDKFCTSRLGFMRDGTFSPYSENLEFDGDEAFSYIFESIKQKGDYDKWLECAIKCRSDNKIAHTMLAASFASVLICKVGALPFFVHLWGGGSGTGKTVALMLAASVWGNPEIGTYPQTFNATQVGHEKTAAFLNNLPMFIDELQLSKDSHGHSKFDVYQLAQGVGRTRGNKAGGVEQTPTWKLCILSTGESQIVQSNAGAGAVNRVIDIECKPAGVEKVINDGVGTSRLVKQNYGFAGRKFVESLTEDVIKDCVSKYDATFARLCQGETTEKQAMAAAMILVADQLADKVIFKTGKTLSEKDIAEFLQTKDSVSVGKRGYDFLCDWVSMNAQRFEDNTQERYGKIDVDYAYIIRTVYEREMSNAGFDGRAVLSWMRSQDLILCDNDGKHLARKSRIGNIVTRCVVVKIEGLYEPADDEADIEDLI